MQILKKKQQFRLQTFKEYFDSLENDVKYELIDKLAKRLVLLDFDFPVNTLFSQSIGKDSANLFLDYFFCKVVTFEGLRKIITSLSSESLAFLRSIIYSSYGCCQLEKKLVPDDVNFSEIASIGLLFLDDLGSRYEIKIPLEVCMIFSVIVRDANSFDLNRPIYTFIYASFSFSLLKQLANEYSVMPQKNNKLAVAVNLYYYFVEKVTFDDFKKLTTEEQEMLAILELYGEYMPFQKFLSEDQVYGSSYFYSFPSDPVYSYFHDYEKRDNTVLNTAQKTLVSLIKKGFVCIDESYSKNWQYCVCFEVRSFVKEDIDNKLKKERENLEKELYVKPPAKISEITFNICEDIVRVQLAVVCGLLEVTQKGTFMKKSEKAIVKLLNFSSEEYLNLILSKLEIHFYSERASVCFLDKINYSGAQILYNSFTKTPDKKAVVQALKNINGWVNAKTLCEYFPFTESFARLFTGFYDNEKLLQEIVSILASCGFFLVGKDKKTLKTAELFKQIFVDETWQNSHEVNIITGDMKPIIVQPNLEILVPYNCEEKLLKKLACFCEITAIDKMVHFKLTKKSLQKGLDLKLKPDEIRRTMSVFSSTGIPKTVNQFFDSVFKNHGEAVVYSTSAVIKCSGVALKRKIMAIPKLVVHEISGIQNLLLVSYKDSHDVINFLKKKGIMAISNIEDESENDGVFEKLFYYSKARIKVFIKTVDMTIECALLAPINHGDDFIHAKDLALSESDDYPFHCLKISDIEDVYESTKNGIE